MNKMSNKELNELLRSAFADAAPDKAEAILAAAQSENTAPTVSVTQENRRGRLLKPALLAAAAFLLVIGLTLGLNIMKNNEVYATVQLESDACIEISLNRDCHPVAIGGLDNASEQLARRVDRGETLTEAVDGVLDAMRARGSLSDRSNTVLITVDAPDHSKELLQDVFQAAIDSFSDEDFDGAILTTVASEDSDILRMARRYRISVGKAEMIADILKKDKSYSAELLARLSVNDLNLLTSFRRIRYTRIDSYGESGGCITPEDAIAYAVSESGISDKTAEATLGVDAYGLIYSVTLHGADRVYIYRLNASSGEIVAVSEGRDVRTALMNDKNTPSPAPTEKPSSSASAASSPTASAVSPTVNQPQVAATAPPATEGPQTPQPTASVTEAAKPAPTAARPTDPPKPKPTIAPTQAPVTEPPAFASDDYIRTGEPQSRSLPSSARQVGVRRILNGYDIFCDSNHFPYSPAGQQGGIAALVCNREQLYRLTGSDDSRFDDSYFESHVLYIYMNRDVTYHWIKSVEGAYMDGGTLYLQNSDTVGYYITGDTPERIYTVVYELSKSELEGFKGITELE